MAFRDDREALRAKKEVLEGEVEDLKRALYQAEKKLATHEKKDEADEDELERLRQEVGALKKRLGVADPDSGQSATVAIAAAVFLLAILVAGAWWVSQRRDDKAGGPSELIEDGGRPAAESGSASAFPTVPTAPEPSSFDAAYFGGVIVATEGMNAQVGDGCVVEVELSRAPRRVRIQCRELLHAARPASSTLMYEAGEGDVVDGYALRTSDASLMIDTTSHEVLVEPREGAFARLYVDPLGVAATDAEPPTDVLPFEGEQDADPELGSLLRELEADATCEVSGSFDGRMLLSPEEGSAVSLRASGRSLHRTTVNGRVVENEETTRRTLSTPIGSIESVPEVDCDSRLVVFEEGDARASARLGPGFVTLVGIFETPDQALAFWMRRSSADPAEETVELGVEVSAESPSNIGSLPPHVQEAVRQAIEEAER